MSAQRTTTDGWLRPRDARKPRRARAHYRLGPAFAAPAAAAAGALGASVPALGIPEPPSGRHAIISGSISLAAHLAIVGFLALSAWLAPSGVEQLLPVQIIHEVAAPTPPPVARRVVVPRRAVPRARAATPVARSAPVARPVTQAVAARTVAHAGIQATAAPTPIAQRRVESLQAVARTPVAAPGRAAVAVAPIASVGVASADLNAPTLAVGGPHTIAATDAVEVAAPQAFTQYESTADVEYTTDASVTASAVEVPVAQTGFAIDADLAQAAPTHAGAVGGTGNAIGAMPCMQRESVVHYYKQYVEQRTRAEWRHFDLPANVAADSRVVLHFVLDESGSASSVSVVDAPSEALGISCQQALVAASPFPAMDEDVRCLAGRKLSGTFTLPVAEAP